MIIRPQRSKFLRALLPVLEEIAPLSLADGTWDNVGLIYESLREPKAVPKLFLTIDLTFEVIQEAINKEVDFILSYHPPWFHSQKKMSLDNLPILVLAAEHKISVYSMHTSLDAMKGGINDWLLKYIFDVEGYPLEIGVETGMGRKGQLKEKLALTEIIHRVKGKLNLEKIRVAKSSCGPEYISTIAVCAGSGGSILKNIKADLYLTGEMSHHEILTSVTSGTSVILCEHTNSERGFLKELKSIIISHFTCNVIISQLDKDPISII